VARADYVGRDLRVQAVEVLRAIKEVGGDPIAPRVISLFRYLPFWRASTAANTSPSCSM
jgi:hypothetical protein